MKASQADPETSFSKYHLEETLGKGSFGIVYKARLYLPTEIASPPPNKRARTKHPSKSFNELALYSPDNYDFRAIKKVPCNAPESVDLALHEFWALLALGYHENVIYFEDCYLQTEEKIVPMRNLKNNGNNENKTCQAYLNLLEASLKGECLAYTTQKREFTRMNSSLLPVCRKLKKSASAGSPAIPQISTWATEIKCLQKTRHEIFGQSEFATTTSNSYFLWFVMEYCQGGDLNSHLLTERNTLLKSQQHKKTAKYIIDLTNGVKFLHENGVIHRDLKPENILVSCQINDVVLKIADFGLSKVCQGKSVETTILQSACGSDYFMAPEVYQGSYTCKADIFSLGCMLYAICTELTFFEGDKELYGVYVEESLVDKSKKFHKKVPPDRVQTAQSSPMRIRERSFRKRSKRSIEEEIEKKKKGKFVPLGEAQLIDSDFDAGLIYGYDKEPCIKGNWTKVRSFIMQLLQKNPGMRPSAEECSSTMFNLMDVRMTRRRTGKFSKPRSVR